MLVIPAVDIKGGKCVRLLRGMAQAETVYSENPVEVAQKWAAMGARWIHVVDLDGAFSGRLVNLDLIAALLKAVPVAVQCGGGIRDLETIATLLGSGARRVVLGTRACEREFLKDAIERFGEAIAVGIDEREGLVTIKGWQEYTMLDAVEFARQVEKMGVRTIVFTDISVDGTLEGPNYASIERILGAVSVPVIASGGVSSLADIERLRALGPKGLAGVIVGKALYSGAIDLTAALAAVG